MPDLQRVSRLRGADVLADFYRQEFLKHHECLERQREYFSDRAITEAEDGLMRLMGQLDQLCASEDAGELVAALLRQFDVVTGLSALTRMSDGSRAH